jgi:hypothetical protein
MTAADRYQSKATEALERSDRARQPQTKQFLIAVALVYRSLADREDVMSWCFPTERHSLLTEARAVHSLTVW